MSEGNLHNGGTIDEGTVARDIEHAGEKASLELASLLAREKKLHGSVYATKIRVKSYQDLISKRDRKIKEKPEYSLLTITDVVGLRVVTLFRSQMIDAVREILDIISRETECFSDSLEQVIVYKANKATDDTAEKINDTLSSLGIESQLSRDENHAAGYSSIHIVARMSERGRLDDNPDTFKNYLIPLEIQIRTLFEDAWGEIDHLYGYQARSGKRAQDLGDMTLAQEQHLIALKSFVDACGDYVDAIQTEFRSPSAKAVKSEVQRINVEGSITARFAELNVPEKLVVEFSVIAESVKEIETVKSGSLNSVQNIKIADNYKELYEHAKSDSDLNDEARRLFLYYVRMNEGVYRLRSSLPRQCRLAIKIYDDIISEHGEYPLPYFRLAQAYSQLNDHSKAFSLFDKTKKLYQKAKSDSADPEIKDKLPQPERELLGLLIPKFSGYVKWKLFKDSQEQGEPDLELLRQAHDLTILDSTEYKKTDRIDNYSQALRDCSNNLLWYSVEYCKVTNKEDKLFGSYYQDAKKQLEYLSSTTVLDDCTDIQLLDTLLFAREFFEDHEISLLIANRLSELIYPNTMEHGSKDRFESLNERKFREISARVNNVLRRAAIQRTIET